FFAISRPKRIVLKGYTNSGRAITIEAADILARCFLHEIDHLNGVLIIDHASKQEKEFWREKISQLAVHAKK
ncbi:MAG: peptide deformylase, partial [Candidatus Omnitrophica bacterium]|nr:peptide deformylase [Candidatus Omnitrophota bacterium]